MRQPVAGSMQLLSAFAPASVVQNEGPGTLYLYRNSAVSAAAYDAVIGPGGTATWPGGEVWGFSSSTIVNILNVGAGIDSGSVAISGTVKVESTGGGTTPPPNVTYRGATSTSGGSPGSTSAQTPTGLSVGDLLIMTAGCSGANLPGGVTGWTIAYSFQSNFNTNYLLRVYYKVADAADVAGKTYTVSNNTGQGYMEALMQGIGNITVTANPPVTANQVNANQIAETSFSSKKGQLAQAIVFSPTSGSISFGWSGSATPPPGPPAWNTAGNTDGFALYSGMTIPTWDASTSYTGRAVSSGPVSGDYLTLVWG